jgi:hypothetical protein
MEIYSIYELSPHEQFSWNELPLQIAGYLYSTTDLLNIDGDTVCDIQPQVSEYCLRRNNVRKYVTLSWFFTDSIFCLRKDVINDSDYSVVATEQWIGNGVSGSCRDLLCFPVCCLGRLRKPTKSIGFVPADMRTSHVPNKWNNLRFCQLAPCFGLGVVLLGWLFEPEDAGDMWLRNVLTFTGLHGVIFQKIGPLELTFSKLQIK